jgi:signal transduction histidine kinase/DNA-binding NarL/FixJ family response regulator/HPt (histidine-containing phosphotransfer) domain-containing protein
MSGSAPTQQNDCQPQARSSGATRDVELRGYIEAALRPRARLLTLPPELEARYEAATWRNRGRSLRGWLVVLATIDLLCIGIDAITMPGHLAEAIVARGVILTGLYLGAAALLLRQRPAWVCGLALLVPTIALILVAGYLANLVGGLHGERYLTAAMFTSFATTIVPNVRFRWAVTQAVLSVLTIGVLLLYQENISALSAAIDNIELVTFYPVSILVALEVRRRIERMHRRNFLMALRDELRVGDVELAKARSDAALGNMSQGIVLVETDGLVPVINRRAVELLGLPESFLDRTVHSSDIVRYQRESGEFDDPSFPPAVAVAVKTGRDLPPLYERRRPNGTVIEVRSTAVPDGRVVRTYTDITERKNYESALARARDIAEAASRARSEFLAMMSHEIRTPMNAVLGLTGSLLETSLDESQRKSAEAIQEASDGLLKILNDILDLSKLDAGKLDFEPLPFSLEAVIDNTRSMIDARAAEKGLMTRVEIAPDLPKALVGDANRIRQIVLNLASNAVRFTPSGEVVISARCVRRDETRATVRVAVRDTGVGIAPDRLGSLFTNFVQADASIHRQYGGTGLGLAICKRLVDQMGGGISVESVLGRGSTFWFEVSLPLAGLADLEQGNVSTSAVGLSETLGRLGRPLRVLVAEDNATNQLVVRRMLNDFAIDLHIANDGVEAVAAATQGDFDVVFMDVRMPRMDGLEATRAIRAHDGRRAAVPIIALTANAFADDVKACRDAGMNDFVAKPIRKQILIDKLVKVAGAVPSAVQRGMQSPARTPAGSGALPDEDRDAALIDRPVIAMLREEIGEDAVDETLRVFRREAEERIALLGKLSAEKDRAAIEVEAHTLKGAAGAVGFAKVSALSRALERQAMELADHMPLVARIEAAFRQSCADLKRHPVKAAPGPANGLMRGAGP